MEASTSKMTIEAQAKKAASPLLALLRDSDRAKLIKQGAEAVSWHVMLTDEPHKGSPATTRSC